MYIFFCKTIWRNAYAKTSNGRLSTRFHVLRPAVSRLNRRTAYKGAVHTNLTKMVKLTDGLVTFSTDNPADCRCFDVTPMGWHDEHVARTCHLFKGLRILSVGFRICTFITVKTTAAPPPHFNDNIIYRNFSRLNILLRLLYSDFSTVWRDRTKENISIGFVGI